LGSNSTQFQWFGAGDLKDLYTPKAYHHGFTETATATTYAPPTVSGVSNPNTVVQYDLDDQIDLVTRPDGKTLDFQYSATTGQLTGIVGTSSGTVSFEYGPAPSCAVGAYCACDASCQAKNPGIISAI